MKDHHQDKLILAWGKSFSPLYNSGTVSSGSKCLLLLKGDKSKTSRAQTSLQINIIEDQQIQPSDATKGYSLKTKRTLKRCFLLMLTITNINVSLEVVGL